MVSLYDKAILDKLNRWTKDSGMTIVKENSERQLFEKIADMTQDSSIKLPLISLVRQGGYKILNTSKKPMVFDGKTLDATLEKSVQLNAIPIEIKYRIDIYTRYEEEADSIMRDLIFNLITFPALEIVIPYQGQNYVHESNITTLDSVDNTSNFTLRLQEGQITRYTIYVAIEDAYLWDVRIRDNRTIVSETIVE